MVRHPRGLRGESPALGELRNEARGGKTGAPESGIPPTAPLRPLHHTPVGLASAWASGSDDAVKGLSCFYYKCSAKCIVVGEGVEANKTLTLLSLCCCESRIIRRRETEIGGCVRRQRAVVVHLYECWIYELCVTDGDMGEREEFSPWGRRAVDQSARCVASDHINR